MSKRLFAVTLIITAALVNTQCGGSQTASSSGSLSLASSPSSLAEGMRTTRAVGDPTSAVAELGKIKVCKAGNVSGTFTIAGGSGSVSTLPNPTIAPGQCVVVAEDSTAPGQGPASPGASITVIESPATFLVSTSMQRNDAGALSAGTFSNGGSLFLNNYHGFVITFTNNEPPPPPPPGGGTQGCTPGYWKQSQHFDSWTGYAPGADFDATFGVDFFSPNITLAGAAGAGGGGNNALARHAVAALLNSASGGVDYQFSTAQVIDIVQGDGAYAGLSVEQRKDLLAIANERGCPLN